MAKYCAACGKKIGLKWSEFKDGTILCRQCNETYQKEPIKIANKLRKKGIDFEIKEIGRAKEENRNLDPLANIWEKGRTRVRTQISSREKGGDKDIQILLQIILLFAGIISLLSCIVAGLDMVSLRSVAGNTIAEAYYNSVGVFVIGIGIFAFAVLIGLATIIGKK